MTERLELIAGYYLQKRDDDAWHIGGPLGDVRSHLGLLITSTTGIGPGGSIDAEVKSFAQAVMPKATPELADAVRNLDRLCKASEPNDEKGAMNSIVFADELLTAWPLIRAALNVEDRRP